ncbi:MAG: JAB domain-containing protein, partial [Odoribacter sp.]|nr:JAB domain-containing protein [Odoribacter sp.]
LLLKEAFAPDTIAYKEYVKLISLDRSHKVVGITTISEGGMDGSVIDIRLILQIALLTHSSALILAHNHPSGTLRPSRQDDIITKKVKDAAQLMDITLCDHLIVCEDGYYSYADEGKL